MSDDPRARLRQHLRQRVEMGERALFLRDVSALRWLETLEHGFPPDTTSVAAATPARTHEDDPFEALRAEALACTRCALCEGRTHVVFGEGDRHADLLVVGEAPGREEDRTGRPFVGAAGKLLDTLLLSAGFRRDEVYICNVLKCRPPQNRDPDPSEIATCRPYLNGQIEHIGPKLVVAFGRFAAQTLLGTEASLGRLRGVEHDLHGVPVVVTYHPAALLRKPEWTRAVWEDLQRLRRAYERVGGRAPRGALGG
ncbi:MAG: uracil-DNA glycosylase [Gemmatimonadota bacterium]